jgi:hypothetical protein
MIRGVHLLRHRAGSRHGGDDCARDGAKSPSSADFRAAGSYPSSRRHPQEEDHAAGTRHRRQLEWPTLTGRRSDPLQFRARHQRQRSGDEVSRPRLHGKAYAGRIVEILCLLCRNHHQGPSRKRRPLPGRHHHRRAARRSSRLELVWQHSRQNDRRLWHPLEKVGPSGRWRKSPDREGMADHQGGEHQGEQSA